jgi:hypothetical protein
MGAVAGMGDERRLTVVSVFKQVISGRKRVDMKM